MVNPKATYSYFLVGQYVETKVAKHIVELFGHLSEFIKSVGPSIEKVDKTIQAIKITQFFKVDPSKLKLGISLDLDSAQLALANYHKTFDNINLALTELMSNNDIETYLAERGVPAEEVAFFEGEVGEYFHQNYALFVGKWGIILDHLQVLKETLQEEIDTLSPILKGQTYLEGLAANQKTWGLFQLERDTFWGLVRDSKFTKDELTHLETEANLQVSKAKVVVQAYRDLLNANVNQELSRIDQEKLSKAQREAKKAIFQMVAALGALRILHESPSNSIKEGILHRIKMHYFTNLDKEGELLLEKAGDLVFGFIPGTA